MHAHMYTWHKCSCVHDDIYIRIYIYIYIYIYYIIICQGAADSAHILRLSTAASFPRRATKVQSGEMLYEFTSPATGYIGLLGLVMFNGIIHLRYLLLRLLYPIES